jgi:hypothetical protein
VSRWVPGPSSRLGAVLMYDQAGSSSQSNLLAFTGHRSEKAESPSSTISHARSEESEEDDLVAETSVISAFEGQDDAARDDAEREEEEEGSEEDSEMDSEDGSDDSSENDDDEEDEEDDRTDRDASTASSADSSFAMSESTASVSSEDSPLPTRRASAKPRTTKSPVKARATPAKLVTALAESAKKKLTPRSARPVPAETGRSGKKNGGTPLGDVVVQDKSASAGVADVEEEDDYVVPSKKGASGSGEDTETPIKAKKKRYVSGAGG